VNLPAGGDASPSEFSPEQTARPSLSRPQIARPLVDIWVKPFLLMAESSAFVASPPSLLIRRGCVQEADVTAITRIPALRNCTTKWKLPDALVGCRPSNSHFPGPMAVALPSKSALCVARSQEVPVVRGVSFPRGHRPARDATPKRAPGATPGWF
jgi:hypothetical protein